LTDISSYELARLKNRTDLKIFPYLKTGYLGFVTNKNPTADIHFRRAIAMAIDKSKFGELLHGGQQAASSFVSPPLLGSKNFIGIPYDPTRAKAEFNCLNWM